MQTVYELHEDDKEKLREPQGDVVDGDDAVVEELEQRDYHRLICVGDHVSQVVSQSNVDADIYVVDGMIEREPAEDIALETDLTLTTENPAGIITEDAWNTAREAVAHTCSVELRVDGEEDLLALPMILFASPDSLIVHGHWQEGAVLLTPDEALKQFVRDTIGYTPFPELVVGGSWDQFHAGHRYLLLAAFEHGDHATIGITSDDMLTEKTEDGEPYEAREDSVSSFLQQFGVSERADIVQIEDFKGPAVEMDANILLATDETLENAKKVNQERLSNGKTPLNLAVLDRIMGEDGEPISSSRVRNGEIDRDGRAR